MPGPDTPLSSVSTKYFFGAHCTSTTKKSSKQLRLTLKGKVMCRYIFSGDLCRYVDNRCCFSNFSLNVNEEKRSQNEKEFHGEVGSVRLINFFFTSELRFV